EWSNDHCYFADHHALHLSYRHDSAGASDRYGSSVHLQYSGCCLYCGGHTHAPASTNQATSLKGTTMDNVTLIAIASICTAGFATSIGCMMPALSEGRSVATA